MNNNRKKLISILNSVIVALVLGANSIAVCAQDLSDMTFTLGKDGFIYLILNHPGFLSDRAKKDLTSGLLTKAAILVQVQDQTGSVVFQNLGVLSAKYDLWEETFDLSVYEGKSTTANLNEVVSAFEKPKPLRIVQADQLKKGVLYRIRSIETINPLDQEKFDVVQNWMIEQRVAVKGLGGGTDGSSVPSVPETPFKTLFHSLWQRSKLGEPLTGELRRELVSVPMGVDALTLQRTVK
jgi:hypothetical protein